MNILLEILHQMWMTLCEMSPYIIFGFLIAGILSEMIKPSTIEKHLGGNSFLSIVKAALFGVPLPLCSCSVIPVTVSLRQHGASKAAVTSFLLSTPQTGVDSFFVTYGMLGPVFAVFRPIVALITGIVGGCGVSFFDKEDSVIKDVPSECCQKVMGNKFTRIFSYGFIKLGLEIAKPLIFGIFIAGLIAALVPSDFFMENFESGLGQMLIMMLIGVPMYVCSSASVPIAASLIAKGISPGAALIFLITGAATNAAGLTTVYKIMGKKITVIYFLTVVVTALASGFVLNWIANFVDIKAWVEHNHAEFLPFSIKVISSIFLLGLFLYGFLRKYFKKDKNSSCSCSH